MKMTTEKAIDPVCGMTVDPAKAAGQWEYKGQQYYFCNPSCLTKFKASPETYLSAPARAHHGHQHPAPPLLQIGRKPGSVPSIVPGPQAPRPAGSPPPGSAGTQYICPMDP